MIAAVTCEGVWKRYRLKRQHLRYMLTDLLTRRRADGEKGATLWALRDLTLEIPQGQTLGIIGSNGAGKSTLLRIVAGVTYPNEGHVRVRGRLGALVDVGAGMHPDLTGRENVFLYGALIGVPRRAIRERFDSIVAFSELEEFLDMPVRHYSSGMKIRLGFSVATQFDPAVFLVDEVLAVGDVGFQRKSINRILDLQRGGTTVIFVSHDLVMVERLCTQVAWLETGTLREVGPTDQVIARYLRTVDQKFLRQIPDVTRTNGALEVSRIALTDAVGAERREFAQGEPIGINLHYRVREGSLPVTISFKITDEQRRTLTIAHSVPEVSPLELTGEGVVRCVFEQPPLMPRLYQVWVRVLRAPNFAEELAWQPVAAFAVRAEERGVHQTHALDGSDLPLLDLPTRWSVSPLRSALRAPGGGSR